MTAPFVPPTYPFDRLAPIAALGAAREGGLVDLSVGTPCDPPPKVLLEALAASGAERGYPSGVGSAALLSAATGYLSRRFGVEIERVEIAACIGTKEFVAGLPHWLRLRRPERDVVLCPAVAYPTYAMGALLAGARPVSVPRDEDGRLALDEVAEADIERALCLWVNSPSNPTGALDDLGELAAWGRRHDVLVCSDECYAEFTWTDRPRTILEAGTSGVLALHSISKRSNAAGLRCGVYAGDAEIVSYLAELRRHAGFMVPGPVQAAVAAAFEDDGHVERQREVYRHRLEELSAMFAALGVEATLPGGGFYLWMSVDESSVKALGSLVDADEPRPAEEPAAWAFTRRLAELGGALVSPGDFYADSAFDRVRVAAVQPDDKIALVARRLGVAG